jgi:hypothetical protein
MIHIAIANKGLVACYEALTNASMASETAVSDRDIYIDNNYYNKKMDESTHKKTGEQHFRLTQYLRNKLLQLLTLSKRNELLMSKQLLTEIEAIMNRVTDPILLQVLNTSFLPAKSYYIYKQKDHQNTLQLLHHAIDNDDQLESTGFDILHFHKMQQVNNVARIHYATKDIDRWATVISDCLLYAFGLKPAYYKGCWNQQYNDASPDNKELLLLFVRQILNESVVFDHYLKNRYLHTIISPLWSSLNNVFDSVLSHWLQIQKSFSETDVPTDYDSICHFLATAPPKYDLLKFSVLWTVYNFEEQGNTEKKVLMSQCLDKLDIARVFKVKTKNQLSC